MRGGLWYHPPPADPHVAADRERPGSVRSFVRRGSGWSSTGGTSPSGGTARVDDDGDRRSPAAGLRLGRRGGFFPGGGILPRDGRRRFREPGAGPAIGRRCVDCPALPLATGATYVSRFRGWPTDNLQPGPLRRGPPDRARTRSGSTCSASSRTTRSPGRKRGQDGHEGGWGPVRLRDLGGAEVRRIDCPLEQNVADPPCCVDDRTSALTGSSERASCAARSARWTVTGVGESEHAEERRGPAVPGTARSGDRVNHRTPTRAVLQLERRTSFGDVVLGATEEIVPGANGRSEVEGNVERSESCLVVDDVETIGRSRGGFRQAGILADGELQAECVLDDPGASAGAKATDVMLRLRPGSPPGRRAARTRPPGRRPSPARRPGSSADAATRRCSPAGGASCR